MWWCVVTEKRGCHTRIGGGNNPKGDSDPTMEADGEGRMPEVVALSRELRCGGFAKRPAMRGIFFFGRPGSLGLSLLGSLPKRAYLENPSTNWRVLLGAFPAREGAGPAARYEVVGIGRGQPGCIFRTHQDPRVQCWIAILRTNTCR